MGRKDNRDSRDRKGKRQYIVIGLGSFGKSVALTLMQNGCEVMAVDSDEERTREVADYVTCAITADICEPDVIKGFGISNFDAAIIAIGEKLEACIMATMLVKEEGVRHIVAKAPNELHAKILRKVGADRVVLPEQELGIRYANNLIHDNFFEAVELSEDVSMMEIPVKEYWDGKSLRDLNMRAKYKVNIIGIKTEDGMEVNPDPDEPLNADDTLVAIGRNEYLKRVIEEGREN